jgi:tRNA (guanine37-N1)-methyltransferase
LLDKNPSVRTVINKTLNVGTKSAFRTFPYEVLAGPDDLDVTVNESGCEFSFNFGKVYWNSRLGSEHERLLFKFQEGEAICDVMAGVGPFAVPAGKKKVFVYANDLNPDSYVGLKNAIERNKVSDFVRPFCEDGRSFIREATQKLALLPRKVHWTPNLRLPRHLGRAEVEKRRNETTRIYVEPTSFDHYVMNLPDSAVEFLDAFRGVYAGRESDFVPNTIRKLPMVHVYLFQAKHPTNEEEHKEICERISGHLGAPIRVSDPSCELDLYYSRLVAPNKKYYCASFRLPAAVAFASR